MVPLPLQTMRAILQAKLEKYEMQAYQHRIDERIALQLGHTRQAMEAAHIAHTAERAAATIEDMIAELDGRLSAEDSDGEREFTNLRIRILDGQAEDRPRDSRILAARRTL